VTSEDSAAGPNSDDLESDKLSYDQDRRDIILAAMVDGINRGSLPPTEVTLFCSGTVVTGRIVSYAEYMRHMGGEESEIEQPPADELPHFVHLTGFRMLGLSGQSDFVTDSGQTLCLRVRISSVDAFVLGKASSGSPRA